MAACAGIRADGGRCKAQAIRNGEYCFNHSPDHAEARRLRASKGGKRGGRGRPGADLSGIKREIRSVIGVVLTGKVAPNVGGVALQGFNALLRAESVELAMREQLELVGRLEEIEAALERSNMERSNMERSNSSYGSAG